MINNIIDIADKKTLQLLKTELINSNSDPKQIIKKYIKQYQEIKDEKENYNIYTYYINFGNDRTIQNFKKSINHMAPCSKPQNYPKIRNAKGKWKNIYEMAFGSSNKEIKIKTQKTKSKQIIKEAA